MATPQNPANRYVRALSAEDLEPNSTYAFILELAGSASTVLDVGCNTGYLGRLFLDAGAKVWGIDNDVEALATAEAAGLTVSLSDLDVAPIDEAFPGHTFDLIVFADVLEHLKWPDRVLAAARSLLAPGGAVIASIPNVAHGSVRLQLMLGDFSYSTIGLLDNTHLRFFTGSTVSQLFAEAGLAIEGVRRVTAPVPHELISGVAERLGLEVGAPDLLSLLESEDAETFQYVVCGRSAESPGPSGALWTMGDRSVQTVTSPRYLCVDAVPNVVADMRGVIVGLENSVRSYEEVIGGLEASLAETQAYLATVIHDKDDLIGGLEASLAETQAYLAEVIRQRDERVAGLEGSLNEMQARVERVTLPTVTVIVVNWNGAHLLSDCLSSLRQQSYPSARFQVVVVDNGSADGSVSLLRQQFPDVTLIEAGENLGFAAGNNVAIEASESDYVALLNNDAVAGPRWLEELVSVAEGDPAIAAVNSKIWLTEDRLSLSVEVSDTFVPGPHDPRRLGVAIGVQARLEGAETEMEFLRGAFAREANEHGTFRWISDSAQVRVPLAEGQTGPVGIAVFPSHWAGGEQPTVTFRIGERVVASATVPRDEPLCLEVPFEPGDLRPVVQNAGSNVLPDGAGSDRGTIVAGSEVFYEADEGQFDRVEDVSAFCGAAALIRRQALAEVGAFDPSFFMYYEDTDLSLRLRRSGWRIVVAPASTVRHRHSATSVEWSPRFCYFTERNRLLMLFKNGSPKLALTEWGKYTARLVKIRETTENRKRFLSVQMSIVRRLPTIAIGRRRDRSTGQGPIIQARKPEAADADGAS